MIFIRNALQAKMDSNSLTELLDKRLKGWDTPRSYKTIHASQITNQEHIFCPREIALLHITKKEQKGRFISSATRVAFDNGDALSDLCRNKWLMWDTVGSWECAYCKHTITFSKRPKGKCEGCGTKDLWRYKEEQFVDPKSGVSGSIDFFIDFDSGKHIAVEVKSIGKDDFKNLVAPLAEHLIRTEIYLELIERSGRADVAKIDTSHAKVLYLSKGYGAKHSDFGRVLPFKDYNVVRNSKRASSYLALGQPVTEFLAGGSIPKGICPSALSPRTKTCVVAAECFGGDYPAGSKLK